MPSCIGLWLGNVSAGAGFGIDSLAVYQIKSW